MNKIFEYNQEVQKLMVERLLEDSFLPRANNVHLGRQVRTDLAKAKLENLQAELGCAKHFQTNIDSAEFLQILQQPY